MEDKKPKTAKATKASQIAKAASTEDKDTAPAADAPAAPDDRLAEHKAAEAANAEQVLQNAAAGTDMNPPIAKPVQTVLDERIAAVVNDHAAGMADPADTLPDVDPNVVPPLDEHETLFIARWPDLNVHVDIPNRHEQDRNGNPARISQAVQFKNGYFKSKNPDLTAALRAQAVRSVQQFREETDPRAAAVFLETFRQKELMDSGTVGGVATSGDGDPTRSIQAAEHLRNMQAKIYNKTGDV